MKPICVTCHRFFRPRKTGFYFIEGKPRTNNALPGKEHAADWEPYKLWSGDRFECEGCGANIVVGVGFNPVAEDHQSKFAGYVKSLGADQFQVNDC